jgi:hypothetical protein
MKWHLIRKRHFLGFFSDPRISTVCQSQDWTSQEKQIELKSNHIYKGRRRLFQEDLVALWTVKKGYHRIICATFANCFHVYARWCNRNRKLLELMKEDSWASTTARVSYPYPYWIRIQSDQWIRIHKSGKNKKFHVLKC